MKNEKKQKNKMKKNDKDKPYGLASLFYDSDAERKKVEEEEMKAVFEYWHQMYD